MPLRIELRGDPTGQAGFAHGVAQCHAVLVPGCRDRPAHILARKKARADEAEERALLVLEVDDVDAGAFRAAFGNAPRDLECIDDAHGAVEPATLGHRVGMRADQHRPLDTLHPAIDVADLVDARLEPGFRKLVAGPGPGRHIVAAEGGAVHPGLELADLGQRTEVGKQSVGVDRHCRSRDMSDRQRVPDRARAVKADQRT